MLYDRPALSEAEEVKARELTEQLKALLIKWRVAENVPRHVIRAALRDIIGHFDLHKG